MEKLEAEKLSAERERQKIEKEERENLRKQQQAEDNLPPEPAVGTAGVRYNNQKWNFTFLRAASFDSASPMDESCHEDSWKVIDLLCYSSLLVLRASMRYFVKNDVR